MMGNLGYRLLLAAGALLLLQSPAAALCFRSFNFNLTSEGPWNGYGTVNQGKTCGGHYGAGGTMTFGRLLLIHAPAHGTVRLRGLTFVYTASKGYSGADAFTLRVCGKQGTAEGCANLLYNMTVI
jgi:Bacterial Ig domain